MPLPPPPPDYEQQCPPPHPEHIELQEYPRMPPGVQPQFFNPTYVAQHHAPCVLQVQQPALLEDYSLPRVKVPGIVMLLAAYFSSVEYTRLGRSGASSLVPVIVYGLVACLCLLVGYGNNKGRGLVALILALSCISLCVALDQTYQAFGGFISMVAVVAALFSVVLVFLTSKKLCPCCGRIGSPN